MRGLLAERELLAREIRDGLAQLLFLAKLRGGELAAAIRRSDSSASLDPETERALSDLNTAIDAALHEARLAALNLTADASATAALRRHNDR